MRDSLTRIRRRESLSQSLKRLSSLSQLNPSPISSSKSNRWQLHALESSQLLYEKKMISFRASAIMESVAQERWSPTVRKTLKRSSILPLLTKFKLKESKTQSRSSMLELQNLRRRRKKRVESELERPIWDWLMWFSQRLGFLVLTNLPFL